MGVNSPAAHTSHTLQYQGALWGSSKQLPLAQPLGLAFPGLTPWCPVPCTDPTASVEELRHAIITNLEQSQDAWPPACPPLEPAR